MSNMLGWIQVKCKLMRTDFYFISK